MHAFNVWVFFTEEEDVGKTCMLQSMINYKT